MRMFYRNPVFFSYDTLFPFHFLSFIHFYYVIPFAWRQPFWIQSAQVICKNSLGAGKLKSHKWYSDLCHSPVLVANYGMQTIHSGTSHREGKKMADFSRLEGGEPDITWPVCCCLRHTHLLFVLSSHFFRAFYFRFSILSLPEILFWWIKNDNIV